MTRSSLPAPGLVLVAAVVAVAVVAVLAVLAARGPGRPAAVPVVAPARGVTAAAQTLTDLAYAQTSPRQVLDLALPQRTGRPVPLVIVVHGGAFLGGDKRDEAYTLKSLAARGYAAASVNYRFSTDAVFPAGVQDVKAAVRWLRAHAGDHGIDPGRFAIWGASAGGYFASMVGVTGDQATGFDDPALGNAGVPSDVLAVVDWYGPVNFASMDAQTVSPGGCPGTPDSHDGPDSPESLFLGAPVQTVPDLVARANPITYLARARHLPRFLVVHGVADCNIPHAQSTELADALREAGAPVTLSLLDGLGHGGQEFYDAQLPVALDFLDGVLRG